MSKRAAILLRVLAGLMAAVLVWAFAVEPLLLTVTELPVTDARLPEALDGVRAVFVSDVHVGPFYRERDVERLAERIKQLHPDMLLFGGDFVERTMYAHDVDWAGVSRAFASIDCRLGKFAVLGNHDIRSLEVQAIVETALADGGFTLLFNGAEEAAPGFLVAGTATWSDGGESSPGNLADVSKTAWATEGGRFAIVLSHEPAQAKNNAKYPFALQLSGHTHAGQVTLPFIGPVLPLKGADGYKFGLYDVERTKLYVSRGIGTSVVRARFLAPPEIVVITFHRN